PSVKRAKGESFPVGVEVRNVEDMASFQLTLGFDPKILEAIEASGGALLEGGEGGYFKSEIDNEKGEVYLVGSTFPTISDDGTLASVSFKAKEEGESLFTFKNAYLYAPKNTLIPCAILTKKIVVQSRPLSDVNQDWVVDISDLVIIGKHFGEAPPTVPEADINKDGKVDISDLVLAAQLFGEESGIVAAP
nr:hypothetical protein [Deltaproteobacteria bacterium]